MSYTAGIALLSGYEETVNGQVLYRASLYLIHASSYSDKISRVRGLYVTDTYRLTCRPWAHR